MDTPISNDVRAEPTGSPERPGQSKHLSEQFFQCLLCRLYLTRLPTAIEAPGGF